jgi:hypothetical protein
MSGWYNERETKRKKRRRLRVEPLKECWKRKASEIGVKSEDVEEKKRKGRRRDYIADSSLIDLG